MFKMILKAVVLVGTTLVSARQFSMVGSNKQDDVDPCAFESRLVFDETMVSDRLLGARGSSTWKPASIRYNDVFRNSGQNVDMVVTAMNTYFGNTLANGVTGDVATINVNTGANLTLHFSFVDRLTSAPMSVKPFHFTVSNLGRYMDMPGGSKGFIASDFLAVAVSKDTNVSSKDSPDGDGVFFTSDFVGARGDMSQRPPTLLNAMTPQQLANSVTLTYPSLSEFEITLVVEQGLGDRDFHFGGSSNLVCEARAVCSSFECPDFYKPKQVMHNIYCSGSTCNVETDTSNCCEPVTPNRCTTAHMLSFSSKTFEYGNLGGFNESYPSGIKFADVFDDPENPIDMYITNTSVYTPGERDSNMVTGMLHGDYLAIDVHADTSVSLLFEFTGETGPITELPSRFSLGIFDFDTQPNGDGQEQVEISGYDSYTLTENTTIKSFDEGESALFEATQPGDASDNPADPMNQTQEQLDKTVSFSFNRTTTSFKMTARVSGGFAGRNILLTGWSSKDCPQLGSYCTLFDCPAGYRQREDPTLRCATQECTEDDFDTCCEPVKFCTMPHRLQLTPDSLVHNNLGNAGPDTAAPRIMRFVDIFPQSHRNLEMKLSVTGRYYTIQPESEHNRPNNGMDGGFVRIDVLAGTKIRVNFEVFDMTTNMVAPATFHLTVASLSETKAQSVTAWDVDFYNVSSNTTLKIESRSMTRGEGVKFTGKALVPPRAGLPASAMRLDDKELSRSVTLSYIDKNSAQLSLAVASGQGYRSFYIGGTSRLVCPTRTASCISMTCPDSYRLKTSAASIMCKGRRCEKIDVDSCCEPVSYLSCDPSKSMTLVESNLVMSNLGGLGPGTGRPVMLFSNVFPFSDRHVDLEISNTTPYHPHDVSSNGLFRGFGSISMEANESTDFEFRLIDRAQDDFFVANHMYDFSLVNLQADVDPMTGKVEALPSVAVPEAQDRLLTDRSFVHERAGVFTANAFGGLPTPTQPWELGVNHMNSAISLKLNTSVFHVQTQFGMGRKADRRLLFTGPTNLACPRRANCNSHKCPADMEPIASANSTPCLGAVCTKLDDLACCRYSACNSENTLDLSKLIYSNLGNMGPDIPAEGQKFQESLIYHDVFPNSGSEIDLVVSVHPDSQYFPYNPKRNGVFNGYGIINLKTGANAALSFNFHQHSNGQTDSALVKPPRFFFSVSGIDEQKEMGVESVKVYKPEFYKVTSGSALTVEEDEEGTTFTANRGGGIERTTWKEFTGALLNHTATLLMPSVEHFRVDLSSTSGWAGRNFVFTGSTGITCGKRAECVKMVCDDGFKLRADAHLRTCMGSWCYKEVDQDKCCELKVPHDPAGEKRERDAPAGANAAVEDMLPTEDAWTIARNR